MRKLKLIILFMLIFMVSACSKKDENDEAYTGGMSEKELNIMIQNTKQDELPVLSAEENQKLLKNNRKAAYENIAGRSIITWDEKVTGLKKPVGIICRDSGILVLDNERSALIEVDYSGTPVNKIGSLGSAELEFQEPTGMTQVEGKIYIIDSLNKRVQVLANDLTYIKDIKQIEYNTFDGTDYRSIALDNLNNIYLAGNLLMDRKIVVKNSDGKLKEQLDNFYGTVYGDETGAYALNRGQIYVEPQNQSLGVGVGMNKLYSLSGGQYKLITKLPENLGILTFCVKQNKIYCISHTEQAVMSFDMSGNFIEMIGELKDSDVQEQEYYIDVDNQGTVYVARPAKERIDVYQ